MSPHEYHRDRWIIRGIYIMEAKEDVQVVTANQEMPSLLPKIIVRLCIQINKQEHRKTYIEAMIICSEE